MFPLLNKELNFSLCSDTAQTARQFSQEQLLTQAVQLNQEGQFPSEVLQQLAAKGFFTLCLPQSSGGLGCSYLEYAEVMREISLACASSAITLSVTNMVALIVDKHAAPSLAKPMRQRFRERQPYLFAFAITEPEAGSDARAISSSYHSSKSGFVLRGHKCFITSGSYADAFATTARSEADPKKISFFLVPGQSAGLRIGKPEKKLGLRASNTVQLFYEEIEIPSDHLLGEEGDGFKIAMTALNGGRIGVAAQALGIGLAALQAASAWTQKYNNTQGNRWLISEMATVCEAGMLLIDHAAKLADKGVLNPGVASQAKLFCSEQANKMVATAMQIMGNEAYYGNSAVQRHFRDCRVTTLYEGTSEIQRLVIARNLIAQGLAGSL